MSACEVDRDLAGGLRRINMEDDALVAADLADFGDRLNHADFVVDVHDRDHDRVRAQRLLELFDAQQTVRLGVEVGHFETVAFEFAAGVEHGLVFGLDGDQVLALAGIEVRRALDRQVVRLGRTRGPDDFLRICADQRRDLLACILDRLLGFPAIGVGTAGRVAEVLRQIGNHLRGNARIDRRCRRVIEIDREFQHLMLRLKSSLRPKQSPPPASRAHACHHATRSRSLHCRAVFAGRRDRSGTRC